MNNKKKNLKIAEDYCKSVKERTERVWISNNLINLPSGGRKAILKVYRKNFHTVEYDNETGKLCIENGVDVLAVGSYLLSQDDQNYNKIINALK